MCNQLKIGVIADDFTGGSDAASFLSIGGMGTILTNGIPDESFAVPNECEAIVIALKTRTEEKEKAVALSLTAEKWLLKHGVGHIYFKYCSTFDSTAEGNIGPVIDALMEDLCVSETILCPSLPANGRTVSQGILYVNGVRLEESTMRFHPLTPMSQSRIADLMKPQGKYASFEIHHDLLHEDDEKIKAGLDGFRKTNDRFYIIPDYETEEDAERIAELFGCMKLMSGGSGLLKALAQHLRQKSAPHKTFAKASGRAVLAAGSCSAATRSQELYYENAALRSLRLSDEDIMGSTYSSADLYAIACQENTPYLVYSYDTPEGLAKKRNEEGRMLAAKAEETLSSFIRHAALNGAKIIIAAGGETSGAVTQALGFSSFWIGESIAPGVPVLIPVEREDMRIVLKSGNFGQEDFFLKALKMTGGL